MEESKTTLTLQVNDARAGEIEMSISTYGDNEVIFFVTEAEINEINWHAQRIHELHPELAPHEAYYKAIQILFKENISNGTNHGRNEA